MQLWHGRACSSEARRASLEEALPCESCISEVGPELQIREPSQAGASLELTEELKQLTRLVAVSDRASAASSSCERFQLLAQVIKLQTTLRAMEGADFSSPPAKKFKQLSMSSFFEQKQGFQKLTQAVVLEMVGLP